MPKPCIIHGPHGSNLTLSPKSPFSCLWETAYVDETRRLTHVRPEGPKFAYRPRDSPSVPRRSRTPSFPESKGRCWNLPSSSLMLPFPSPLKHAPRVSRETPSPTPGSSLRVPWEALIRPRRSSCCVLPETPSGADEDSDHRDTVGEGSPRD